MSCPNCGSEATGAYCSSCGQSQDVDPKSLSAWIREVLDEMLSIDGRLWRTLTSLALHPGAMVRDWLEGRRQRWTHPLRLYLLASFAFLVLTYVVPAGVTVGVSGVESTPTGIASEVMQERAGEAIRSNYPAMMFVLVPLFALWLKLLYRPLGVVYVGHLVHALYIHAAFFLLLSLTVPAESAPTPLDYVIQIPLVLYLLLYPLMSARGAYGASWVRSTLATLVLVPVHAVSVLIGIGVIAFATGTFSVNTDTDEAHEIYWEARDMLSRGDSIAGRARAGEAVSAYARLPYVLHTPHVRIHHADALLLTGNADEAFTEASHAVDDDSASATAIGIAARAAMARGDSVTATELWALFLRSLVSPDSASEHYQRHATDVLRDQATASEWLAGRDPVPR